MTTSTFIRNFKNRWLKRFSKKFQSNPLFYICGTLAVFLPFLEVSLWHFLNRLYPRNDYAFYLNTTFEIFRTYEKEGLLKALYSLYFMRNLKPVLHPVIAAFFLFTVGGNALGAVWLTSVLFYVILTLYLYKFCIQHCSPLYSLIITLIISNIPWLLNQSFLFSSEMPVAACAIAIAFHYKNSDFSKNRHHTKMWALWLSLSSLFRPELTFIIHGFSIFYFAYMAIRHKTLSPRDLIAPFLGGALFIATVAHLLLIHLSPIELSTQNPSPLHTIYACLIILAPLLGLFLLRNKLRLNTLFLSSFIIFFAPFVVWTLPGIGSINSWIDMSTFGVLAKLDGRVNSSVLVFFIKVFSKLFAPLLYSLLPLLIFSYLALSRKQFRQVFKKISNAIRDPGVIGVCSIFLFPILLGALSLNSSVRYYYPGTAVFACLFFIGIYQLKILSESTINLLAVVICICLLVCNTVQILGRYQNILPDELAIKPPYTEEPLLVPLFTQIAQIANTDKEKSKLFCIYQLFTKKELTWVADPWALSIYAYEKGYKGWIFLRPWPYSYASASEGLKFTRESCNYVLIGPLEGNEKGYDAHAPVSTGAVSKYILDHFNSGELKKVSINELGKMTFFDRKKNQGTMLLLVNKGLPTL